MNHNDSYHLFVQPLVWNKVHIFKSSRNQSVSQTYSHQTKAQTSGWRRDTGIIFYILGVFVKRTLIFMCEMVGVLPLKLRVLRLAFAEKRSRVVPPPWARNEASIWWTPGSSAGQQAGRVVDKTAELIGQVPVVFGQKAAHFYIQKIFGHILHDGSCCLETPQTPDVKKTKQKTV